MNRVLVVEDNIAINQYVCGAIKKKYEYWEVIPATNFEDAKKIVDCSINNSEYISLFLLDISLVNDDVNDSSGFKLAEYIRSQRIYMTTPLLFLTQIDNKYIEALSKYHCYDYIKKPYTDEKITRHIDQMLLMGFLKESFSINDTNRVCHLVSSDEILFIEHINRTLEIHTITKKIITREFTLEEFQRKHGSHMLKCHRAFLVNPIYLNSFTKKEIQLKNTDVKVPIGRNYFEIVYKTLTMDGFTIC